MSDNPGGFDVPPVINSLSESGPNSVKWFKRWYVFVLPLAVGLGALLLAYSS